MAAVNPAAPEPRMMRFLAPLMGTHRPRKGLDACAPGAAIPNRANRRRIQVWVHQIVNYYRRFRNVPAQSPYWSLGRRGSPARPLGRGPGSPVDLDDRSQPFERDLLDPALLHQGLGLLHQVLRS